MMNYESFKEYKDPLWSCLTKVNRPSRYVGKEWGVDKAWNEGSLKFCLAFPDVYEIGMSYIGFQILFSLLNSISGVATDRVYCPWTDMEEEMRERSIALRSISHKIPLSEFDVIGFTLQYELTYTNILTILDLADIPFLSSERNDDHPVILAGGPGALVPAPLSEIVDVFCLGDGEPFLPVFCDLMEKTRGLPREQRLKEISRLPGAYVPLLHGYATEEDKPESRESFPIRRNLVKDLDTAHYPERMIVPNAPVVHDRIPIEIFRGCSRGCRFCQAGMIYRPVRERSPETVLKLMDTLLNSTGWDEVGLVSLASCDYSGILELLKRSQPILDKYNANVTLPSLRMDNFSVQLANSLESHRRGGLTFAPEAGTQRLRNVINKGVTEEDIENTLDSVFAHGWKRVKLYFMMGLPTETEEDLEGIIDIARRAMHIARGYHRRSQINISVAGFVPKAHTPFQWEPQDTIEDLSRKGRFLKSKVHDRNISLHYHEPDQSFLEGVLARGGKELSKVIINAWERGARFDGWTETFNLLLWMRAFEEEGIDPFHIACRRRDLDEKLPWDNIDAGISRSFLWKERELSLKGHVTPDCRWDNCHLCGLEKVCSMLSSNKVSE